MMPLKVVVAGLGPIGQETLRALGGRQGVRLVGAVDVSPALAGRALDEVVPGAPSGLRVEADLAAALVAGADVLVLCTGSRADRVMADLEIAVSHRVHVVSSCEELAVPPTGERWARLDERARQAGVTLLATGVNPGFVMDRLVLQLAGACVQVNRVAAFRVVDVTKRRGPLRRKVGEGLTRAEFDARVAAGTLGHVGLAQSAALIARGLGWRLDHYQETLEPVMDGSRCLGIDQRGKGLVAGEPRIALSLQMFAGAPDPHDQVVLEGDPPIDVRIAGGVQGDRATVGTLVQAAARLSNAPRGLVTVADVFV